MIDAVDMGWRPGEVRRFAARDVPSLFGREGSARQTGVRDALAACRRRGLGPEEVILWGVQVGRRDRRAGLSPSVEAALPAVIAGVRAEAWRVVSEEAA